MVRRGVLAVLLLYAAWLGFLVCHEAGHVLHGFVSGGQVREVVLPLFGFSSTRVEPNPRPRFVLWGGFVWGVAPGWIIWALAAWRRSRAAPPLLFFAGFASIANGAYWAAGALEPAGDPADLIRRGASPTLLIVCGAIAITAGLLAWARLDVLRWLSGRRVDAP